MLPIHLALEFRTRAQGAILSLRRAALMAAPRAHDPRFGAYASLGAIALGGALMMANISRESCAVPLAAARLVAPAPIKAVRAAPKPDPIAAAAALSPPLLRAAEKWTARVDTTPTASIPEKPQVKPKRKRHAKNARELDSER